jgi:thiol-disulfide isomerase/thioredoxin
MDPPRLLASVVAAVIASGTLSSATAQRPPDPNTPAVGNHPGSLSSDFTLKTVAGDTVRLADYRGRPVLINFWASWCSPCRSEMPLIIAAYRAHEDTGLAVLALNLTDQERMRHVRRFVDEFAMPFPVLLDEKGRVRRSYRLLGIPTTVFIGADGVIRAVHPGPITSEALERGLAEILINR